MGRRARARALGDYDWDARLAPFGELIDGAHGARLSLAG
jgi:hypothetical protein